MTRNDTQGPQRAHGAELSSFGLPPGRPHAEIDGVAWVTLVLTLALRGVVHPPTGVALLRVGWRFRRRNWWRRAPFLPLPAMTYVRWRLHTAYGDHDTVPPARDVIRYARWAVQQG